MSRRHFCFLGGAAFVGLVGGRADAVAEPRPRKFRVSVLSLLTPQRVILSSPTRDLVLPDGFRVRAGQTLALERRGAQMTARVGDAQVAWTGTTVTFGGDRRDLTLDVIGKDSRRRTFQGSVEVSVDDDELRIVAEMTLEDLVAAGVSNELADSNNASALEALAVVVRSYIVNHRGRHRNHGFDLCDTTHCFVSRGSLDLSNTHDDVAHKAASATKGLVLSRKGRIVDGYFTACCGGATTTPSEIWGSPDRGDIVPVTCDWCRQSEYFRWEREILVTELHPILERLFSWRFGAEPTIEVRAGRHGWVRWVVIQDGGRSKQVRGDSFRMATERQLGWDRMPSPRFSFDRIQGGYRIKGGGFGHGIGYCLTGAVAQGNAGRSRNEILAHYFPRASVTRLPD